MWILFAAGSAFFAGITAILAKCGIKKTDSDVATAIRTIVVLLFSWLMVAVAGSAGSIGSIGFKTWGFLVLSGMATGASWLCYFKALQLGNINKVVPIDKLSIILTILFAFFFLGEAVSLWKAAGLLGIAAGTLLMIQKREDTEKTDGIAWLIYALLSALFASLTSIFGKIGITEVESNLGTALRTCVVLIMAWLLVLLKGKQRLVRGLPKRELYFILLSGIATGASWLCYYKALKEGPVNAVAPIDKLSILVTIGFSRMVFHERLSKRGALGLLLIVVGTLLMLIK
ncbi:EamA family transporter [Lacrimispora sp. 210928-DFI.3.58]|uniref:EamA family transporter n=1 Tax=Lacrimispora sp. 210928-DFI.3.58 TaxID=2883214 RepID=UPI0015B4961E|nr:EamA family transporter [Lacrimispora sp. 210928-DFI.3.58]MCB7318543.1 EamA family transporter [Lacrimispora sp. 210928-DFI.3.58]